MNANAKRDDADAPYLYVAQLAIPAALEDELNRLYDSGYIPALLKVPGVRSARRYRLEWSDTPDMPEYLAMYEVDHPDVPRSQAWKDAGVACGWAEKVRPHLLVRRHGMFRKGGADSSDRPQNRRDAT